MFAISKFIFPIPVISLLGLPRTQSVIFVLVVSLVLIFLFLWVDLHILMIFPLAQPLSLLQRMVHYYIMPVIWLKLICVFQKLLYPLLIHVFLIFPQLVILISILFCLILVRKVFLKASLLQVVKNSLLLVPRKQVVFKWLSMKFGKKPTSLRKWKMVQNLLLIFMSIMVIQVLPSMLQPMFYLVHLPTLQSSQTSHLAESFLLVELLNFMLF